MSSDRPSFAELARQFLDRRLLAIFLLGIASGFPWVLIGSALAAWLQDAGTSRTDIGLISMVTAAYALNFLWAPLLDRIRLPGNQRLGQRRSWIFLLQGLLALLTFAIGAMQPSAGGLALLVTTCVALAVASATQDIAIDAYRVELIERAETVKISHGAAMATAGWWTGYALLGALPFFLVDQIEGGWPQVYRWLAMLWPLFMLVVLLLPAAQRRAPDYSSSPVPGVLAGVAHWFAETVWRPLAEFFSRNGAQLALGILIFVLLFKLGEAFLGKMAIVFYKEIGFSDQQIGTYSKLLTWWVTIIFALFGSLLNARFGLIRGLVVGGIAMAASNLFLAVIASTGPVEWLFAVFIVVDGFTAAFATVAFVTFISFLTSHAFTATQYALLASIGNFGRTTLTGASGALVDWMGGNWSLFFIITAVMVVPSLLLLWWLTPKLREKYPEGF